MVTCAHLNEQVKIAHEPIAPLPIAAARSYRQVLYYAARGPPMGSWLVEQGVSNSGYAMLAPLQSMVSKMMGYRT